MSQLPHRGNIGESETRWQKKLFLLCGSHTEFAYWARRILEKTDEYCVVYAHEDRIVRGYREEKYICLGNWFQMRDFSAEKTLEIMRLSEFTELRFSDIFDHDSEEAEERDYHTGINSPPDFLSEEDMWI